MKTLSLIRTTLLTALDGAQPVEVAISWGLGASRMEHPRVIVQPVSAGAGKRYIGMPVGWEGEIAIRAQARDLDTAQTIFDAIAAAVPAASTITDTAYAPGWSLRMVADRPIPGLTGPTSATVGAYYRAMLLPRMP